MEKLQQSAIIRLQFLLINYSIVLIVETCIRQGLKIN